MPLLYHPEPGAIVICDFSTGFQLPEMVKVRPVVVVSPRRRTSPLLTVVPLSSTAPQHLEPWHYRLTGGAYPPAKGPIWAKCDLVQTVALGLLERVRSTIAGRQTYYVPQLAGDELAAIRACVKAALGLP